MKKFFKNVCKTIEDYRIALAMKILPEGWMVVSRESPEECVINDMLSMLRGGSDVYNNLYSIMKQNYGSDWRDKIYTAVVEGMRSRKKWIDYYEERLKEVKA